MRRQMHKNEKEQGKSLSARVILFAAGGVLVSLLLHLAFLFSLVNSLLSPGVLNSPLVSRAVPLSVGSVRSRLPWSLTLKEVTLSLPAGDFSAEKCQVRLSPFSLFHGLVDIKTISLEKASLIVKEAPSSGITPEKDPDTQSESDALQKNEPLIPQKIPRFRLRSLSVTELSLAYEGEQAVHSGDFSLLGSAECLTGTLKGLSGFFTFRTGENSVTLKAGGETIVIPYGVSLGAGLYEGALAMKERIQAAEPRREVTLVQEGSYLFSTQERSLLARSFSATLNGMPVMDIQGKVFFNEKMEFESLAFSRLFSDIDLSGVNGILRRAVPGLPEASLAGYVRSRGEARKEEMTGEVTVRIPSAAASGASLDDALLTLSIQGTPQRLEIGAEGSIGSLMVSRMKEPVKNLHFAVKGHLEPHLMTGGWTLEDFSFSLYGGTLRLRGNTPDMDTIQLNLQMRDFTFYNYFDIPLYARLNALAEVTGSLSKGLTLLISAGAEEVDFRTELSPVKIPKISLGGGLIIAPEQKYLYCDNFFLKLGRNNRFLVNGSLEKWGEENINLTLSHSKIDIEELLSFAPGLPDMESRGTINFTLDISGSLAAPFIKTDNTMDGVSLFYPDKKIRMENIDGRLWFEGTPEKWKAVFDCSLGHLQYDSDVFITGLTLSLPYYYGPFSPGELRQGEEINLRMQEGGFQHFIIRDLAASLSAANKKAAVNTFYGRFLDGQIGGTLSADLDDKSYDIQFNAIDLNIRKGTGKGGASLLSMVSRFKGKGTQVEGYWDITKIDSDVLDKALLSLDPDKKNPQIQGMRKKLNMVGVVPKNVLITTSNGFVNIHPTFGFRRSNVVSFVLGFLIGGLDVEPIRRIPLDSILKETGLVF